MSGLLLAAKAALEFIQSIDGYENSVTAVNLRREIQAVEHRMHADEGDSSGEEFTNPYLLSGEELDRAISLRR